MAGIWARCARWTSGRHSYLKASTSPLGLPAVVRLELCHPARRAGAVIRCCSSGRYARRSRAVRAETARSTDGAHTCRGREAAAVALRLVSAPPAGMSVPAVTCALP